MAPKQPITIPASLAAECQAWSSLTSHLIAKLQQQLAQQAAEASPDQAWFWSTAWQAQERQADADLATGQVEAFESVDGLIQDLHAHV